MPATPTYDTVVTDLQIDPERIAARPCWSFEIAERVRKHRKKALRSTLRKKSTPPKQQSPAKKQTTAKKPTPQTRSKPRPATRSRPKREAAAKQAST